ncbi:hypothetical protein GCM10028806_34300 [Spirosoma terrae]|uniref:Uncharacterized protein n=1 Tax=Spirosoma terrae TaxID=1968276 RepID=A0A6L9LAA5_9BACT|nr:hypothetical protein [Spirosoma terrae]NDU95743.1 hypothetical protein [Spirosoma terrae]
MQAIKRHSLAISAVAEADSRTLVILDRSAYFTEPEQALLNVILPGRVTASTIAMNVAGLTTLTGWELGLGGRVELPDGIYQIRYAVAPHDRVSVCLNYLKTSQLNARIDKWLLAVGCDTDDRQLDELGHQLAQLDVLLRAGAANAEAGHFTLATAQYDRASRLLDTFSHV